MRFSHSSWMMALSLFVCVCSFSFITTFVMMMIFGGCSLRLTRRDDYDDRLVNYIIILPTTDLPQAKSDTTHAETARCISQERGTQNR